jgi:hypothetical protein
MDMTQLHWSCHCATIACGKLPLDWEMPYKVAYLAKQ